MVKTGARKLGFINCCSPTDSHTSVQEGTSRGSKTGSPDQGFLY